VAVPLRFSSRSRQRRVWRCTLQVWAAVSMPKGSCGPAGNDARRTRPQLLLPTGVPSRTVRRAEMAYCAEEITTVPTKPETELHALEPPPRMPRLLGGRFHRCVSSVLLDAKPEPRKQACQVSSPCISAPGAIVARRPAVSLVGDSPNALSTIRADATCTKSTDRCAHRCAWNGACNGIVHRLSSPRPGAIPPFWRKG
jgi:hypothetical protein